MSTAHSKVMTGLRKNASNSGTCSNTIAKAWHSKIVGARGTHPSVWLLHLIPMGQYQPDLWGNWNQFSPKNLCPRWMWCLTNTYHRETGSYFTKLGRQCFTPECNIHTLTSLAIVPSLGNTDRQHFRLGYLYGL